MVAAVLAAGSEKAAAHRLGLSPSTVKHHLANARSKVGATTTAHLAPRLPEPAAVLTIVLVVLLVLDVAVPDYDIRPGILLPL